MTVRNFLLLVAICSATWIVVTLWEVPVEQLFADQSPGLAALPIADSYMQGTETRKFNRDGSLGYRLQAKTALYFSASDRLELEGPALTALSKDGNITPWQLTAVTAHTTERGKQVKLTGDVHAWQILKSGRNEFFTDDILFAPGDNTATTESEVTMISPEGKTTGTGMAADFNRKTYHIQANVRAQYHAIY